MGTRDYDLKPALPNKSYNEDGTTTDLLGNPVISSVPEYANKAALPNKWLNPDGSYSTLMELISGAIDTDIFVIVEELPEEGQPNKIYLVPNDDGEMLEYCWVNNEWNPIGMLEFDITDYSTTEQMNTAILAALNSAKAYADALFASIDIPPEIYYYDGNTSTSGKTFWTEILTKTNPVIVYLYTENGKAQYVTYLTNPSQLTGSPIVLKFIAPLDYTRSSSGTGYTYRSQQYYQVNLVKQNGEITAIAMSFNELKANYIDPTVAYDHPFSPAQPYHPATKKYVDDSIATNITNVLGGSY